MKWIYKVVPGYLTLVGIIFVIGYLLLGIREFGLYFFLLALNLPSSMVLVPQMEVVSLNLGLVLGAPLHVWLTQLTCMIANGAILLIVMLGIIKFHGNHNERK